MPYYQASTANKGYTADRELFACPVTLRFDGRRDLRAKWWWTCHDPRPALIRLALHLDSTVFDSFEQASTSLHCVEGKRKDSHIAAFYTIREGEVAAREDRAHSATVRCQRQQDANSRFRQVEAKAHPCWLGTQTFAVPSRVKAAASSRSQWRWPRTAAPVRVVQLRLRLAPRASTLPRSSGRLLDEAEYRRGWPKPECPAL